MRLRRGCDWKTVYEDYLKTPHWQKKRLDTLIYFRGECGACGSMEALEIHHTPEGYKELFAEIAGLHTLALCELCHEREHSNDGWLTYVMQSEKIVKDFGIGLDKSGYDYRSCQP